MIYINVTNTFFTRSKTGIQRVVRKIIEHITVYKDVRFIVFFDSKFKVLNSQVEIEKLIKAENVNPEVDFDFSLIKKGDTYFDIDASWGDFYNFEQTLKKFRERGARIVRLHYDAVPLQFPQFSHINTVCRYREHFYYCAKLVDYWIAISQVVWLDLVKLFENLEMGAPIGGVINLGADFAKYHVFEPVKEIIPDSYFLSVGTIEPRKNVDLLVDSYEEYCKAGVKHKKKLIIVGKEGWNCSDTVKKIKNKISGGQLIWLNTINDNQLAWLYANTTACFQMSHYEGYGLPVVEGLSFQKPVICSENTAMEEIAPGVVIAIKANTNAVVEQMLKLSDSDYTRALSASIAAYTPPSWEESITAIYNFLKSIEHCAIVSNEISQAVYISIRPHHCIESIKLLLKNANFIKHVVIMTNNECISIFEHLANDIEIKITLINENTIIDSPLPADHQERNTFLRKELYAQDIIDDNFLALDDDNLCVSSIKQSDFGDERTHFGYYFFNDGNDWLGSHPEPTSFDQGLFKTINYLNGLKTERKLYNSHQPQIINKKIANVILNRTTGLKLDEWSSYFNLAKFLFPEQFKSRKFCVVGWPENYSDWLPSFMPINPVFINRPLKNALLHSEFDAHIKYNIEKYKKCFSIVEQFGRPEVTYVAHGEKIGFTQSDIIICKNSRLDIEIKTLYIDPNSMLIVKYLGRIIKVELKLLKAKFIHLSDHKDKALTHANLEIEQIYNGKSCRSMLNIIFK